MQVKLVRENFSKVCDGCSGGLERGMLFYFFWRGCCLSEDFLPYLRLWGFCDLDE